MNLFIRLLLLRIRSLRWPRISPWDVVHVPFRVTPADLDLQGHMNNGRYLSLLDLGRLDLLQRSGMWKAMRARGWFPVVAGQTITYRKALRLGQRFDVHTRFAGLDDGWVYIEQAFVTGDTVHAHAMIRTRFLKKSGGRVQDEELLQLSGPIPADRSAPDWTADWTEATRSTSGLKLPG